MATPTPPRWQHQLTPPWLPVREARGQDTVAAFRPIGANLCSSVDMAALRPPGVQLNAMDIATATPTAARAWLPVHEARVERTVASRSEANSQGRQAADLDVNLKHAATEERELRSGHAALLAELQRAEDDFTHESDLQQVLLAEVAERESYSFELQGRLVDAETARSHMAADVANLRSDISKAFEEKVWAGRYRGGVEAQRSRLEEEIHEAENTLLNSRRDLCAAGIAVELAGSDLRKEAQTERASEAFEEEKARNWTRAIEEIQLQRTHLQMQLMQEQQQRQAAANDVNSLRIGPAANPSLKFRYNHRITNT